MDGRARCLVDFAEIPTYRLNMKKTKQPTSYKYRSWILKNILAGGIFLFLIAQIVEKQPAYKWVYESLLKGNMEIIKKYPNLPLEKRYEMKLGFSYTYLDYLKKRTPENAVILYPDKEQFFPKDKKSPFEGDVANKLWALRFLYPRKIISAKEAEMSIYKNDITHIAIVNGLGFEYINYTGEHFEHGILPVKTN